MNEAVPNSSRRWNELWVLAGLLVLGGLVRGLFLLVWSENPLFSSLQGDELNFHQTALALLGKGETPDGFLYQPLVSFYLAAVYGLVGPDPTLVRGLQLIIGLLNVGLFYGLGRELGGRWCGRVTGLLAALYGPFVFFEGLLLAPALAVPALAGGVWCLLRAGLRERAWLLAPAGSLMGLSLMARPNLLILLAVAMIWWFWRVRGKGARWFGVAWAFFGLVVGMAPSWIYNAAQGQGLLPVSASAGHSFFLGNNPQATGRYRVPSQLPIDATSHAAYRRSWVTLAEREQGRSLSISQVSSHWFGRGLAWWAEQPGKALGLFGKKVLLSINSEEVPIHHPYFAIAELIPLLGFLLGFGVMLPFAVAGVWLELRSRKGVALLGVGAIVYLVVGMALFYVADRYRVMVLPLVLPLAGLGMLALGRRFSAGGLKAVWPVMLVLAATFALGQIGFRDEASRTRSRYGLRNLMGKAAGELGDPQRAEQNFRQAIQIAGPHHGSLARENLGLILERRGQAEEALALFRQAAAMDSRDRFVRRHLAELAESAGRLEKAISWWQELVALSAEPEFALRQIDRLRGMIQNPMKLRGVREGVNPSPKQ
jgi:4-amino-4-deoxy-L-arabinose transferase-like glycosyltransferase